MGFEVHSFPGSEIELKGKKFLYFGGTAYLGLQTDAAFKALFVKAIQQYGTNYGASRKSNIQLPIFDRVEQYLTSIVGSEACLTLSSGFLAGQFLAQNLSKDKESYFYAPNTHSALYHTAYKRKSYITFSALNIALRHFLEKTPAKTPIVFLDTIDFSGANYPNFEGLKMLPLAAIILVVDDSHGIGILGENGGGVYQTLKKLPSKELLVSASLGKGFGVQAGAVFGTKKRLQNLSDTAFFGGASPAMPASLATLMEAESIYYYRRQKLQENIRFFLNNLKSINKFKFMKGHPAFSFSDERLTRYLENHQIIVTSFRYPNEDAALMSRIIISAGHSRTDLATLCKVLNSF